MGRARFVPPALAVAASVWGSYIVAGVLARGVSYAGELRGPVVLALFPLAFGIAAWARRRVVSAVFYMAYVMASIIMGFGYGGPHLTVGVPLLTVALFVLFAYATEGRGGAQRKAEEGIPERRRA